MNQTNDNFREVIVGNETTVLQVREANVMLWTVRIGQAELFAMLSAECSPADNPVLILSCVSDNNSTRVACIDVARNLDLQKLTRPWQVCMNLCSQ